MVFLANLVFNFHSGIYITTTFLLVNVHLMQNMKKTLKQQFLCFFSQHWTYFGPDFALKTTPTLLLLAGDTININNLCCNPAVLKKVGKTSSKLVFWTQFAQKRGHYGHAQGGKNFFWQKYQKKIISFQKVFILSKYHMF